MSKFWDKKLRDMEIRKLQEQAGMSVKDLAIKFKISQQTIQRALEGGKI